MRAARNVVIILLLALIVDLVPGGGNAAQAIIAAVGIIFLAMIAWSGYVFYRENRLAYLGLTDRQRAMLLGGLGAIALMIAGASKLTSTSGGTLILIAIVVGAVLAIVKVWTEYRTLY